MFDNFSFLELLVFILIGLLFFKEQIMSWLGARFSGKNGEDAHEEEVTPLWADRLIQYANHDTTKMHEKTHEKLDKFADIMKELTWVIKEMRDACSKSK